MIFQKPLVSVWAYPVLSAIVFLSIGCQQNNDEKLSDNFAIDSDQEKLSQRLELRSDEVAINSDGLELLGIANVELKLIGRLSAPEVGDYKVSAGQVAYSRGVAFVSYMNLGEEYAGALDIIDVSDLSAPVLISSLSSKKHDVNTVSILNEDLWIGGAKGTYSESPAFGVGFSWKNRKLLGRTATIEFPSFAVTDIFLSDERVYVTSGDQGGLTILDRELMTSLAYHPFFDARSVWEKGDKAYIQSAQPGTLHVLDLESDQIDNSHVIGGATTPEDKSHLFVGKHVGVASLNDQGFAVVCLADGKVMAQVDALEGEEINASPNYAMQITVKDRYAYVASGGNGVQIYDFGTDWDNESCLPLNVTRSGSFTLPDDAPATHIVIEGDTMFVSSGEYGLHILKISTPEECNKDEGCLLKQIAATCEGKRKTKEFKVVMPQISECAWGENGNLDKKQGYITARKSTSATIDLPEGATICKIEKIAADETVKVDDWMSFSWNNAVLTSTVRGITYKLPEVGSFEQFDWSTLIGATGLKQGFNKYSYCFESGSCSGIPHDQYANLKMSFSENWSQRLMANLILSGSENEHVLTAVAMGDNDKADCDFRSKSGDVNLSIKVEFVP